MSTNKLNISNQRGAVLIVGLMLLTVLVLIGVTAMNYSAVGEKMTANQRNKELSLQASESALSDAEQWLAVQPDAPEPTSSCTTPPCSVHNGDTYNNLNQLGTSWWSTNATPFSGTLHEVSIQPAYFIELHNFVPYELSPEARSKGEGYYYYQVTARGSGGESQAISHVQSIFSVQFK